MSQLLALQVEIAVRPPDASSETAAAIILRCEALKLKREGDTFSYPLTKKERDDLRWYLEEYWQWPFEGFAQRGSTVEQLLPVLGQRLYQAVFGQGAARDILQQWRADTTGAHQISIITTDAGALSLPWELLHDGQEFLALQANPPISIVRRIAEDQQPSSLATTFEKPLRVLLVTARPVDEGQVDARTIAREVLDVLQDQIAAGTIELEFLRPPTFDKLIARLDDKKRPVHVLHFDGHGVFYRIPRSQDGNNEERGRLFFEKDDRKGDPVDGVSLAEMLGYGGVQVAVLNACQSAAIGERDISSSVAVQLLKGGLQAVVAMSASVMTTSAALYVKAFYGALAAGGSVQTAHEQAQRVLHEHPERNPFQRSLDEAGKPVNLQDWWLPYLYLQRPLELRPTRALGEPKLQLTPSSVRLSESIPAEPRYGFNGRARELLNIERWLMRGKLIVVHGFGGVGKTALVREAADWLTRTKMYEGACFISFEHGGDAAIVLSALGNYMGIYDGNYNPNDKTAALARLKPALKERRILVIADNLESILRDGETPLEATIRTQLWDVLLELAAMGAGILLTSRNSFLGDGRLAQGNKVAHLELNGLYPEDAYALATRLLEDLEIDRKRAPYLELRELLKQLDHHPLAIQLVLPILRELSISMIKADFSELLPTFADDTTMGRNRSLLASLNYSLQRLSEEQHAFLPRLAPFQGGALEPDLLEVIEITKDQWETLRQALEQAALLTQDVILQDITTRFQHFHPVLTPYLRSLPDADDAALYERYTRHYYQLASLLTHLDQRDPQQARLLVKREYPNLRRALEWFLEEERVDEASLMAHHLAEFLTIFGWLRQRDELLQRVARAVAAVKPQTEGMLSPSEWQHEIDMAANERRTGDLQGAISRLTTLLKRIEGLPTGTSHSRESFEHCRTLQELALCCQQVGKTALAERLLRDVLSIIDRLVNQSSNATLLLYSRQRAIALSELGSVLSDLGWYSQAQALYEEAITVFKQLKDPAEEAVMLERLGVLASQQQDYNKARLYHEEALRLLKRIDEPTAEAINWYELGLIAQKQEDWKEAEHCYRESVMIDERRGNQEGAIMAYHQLANLCRLAGRPEEAEGWYKRILRLLEQKQRKSLTYMRALHTFSDFITEEVQANHFSQTRLAEAMVYAEQALTIEQELDNTTEIWKTWNVLATIADLQGQREKARTYRRKEHEAYAAFPGNRSHIGGQHKLLIAAIVAAAMGDHSAKGFIEKILPEGEAQGWQVTQAVRRILAGERDWHLLTEDVNRVSALLILFVLEALADQESM